METKTCKRCDNTFALTFDNFYRSNQTKSGYKAWCKKCTNKSNTSYDKKNPKQLSERVIKSRNRSPETKARHSHNVIKSRTKNHNVYRNNKLMREFGITNDDYEFMLENQGGGCAICGKTKSEEGKHLAVDHCHVSNDVRGVLCQNCNQGLGKFRDDVSLLSSAIRYLQNENCDTRQPECDS